MLTASLYKPCARPAGLLQGTPICHIDQTMCPKYFKYRQNVCHIKNMTELPMSRLLSEGYSRRNSTPVLCLSIAYVMHDVRLWFYLDHYHRKGEIIVIFTILQTLRAIILISSQDCTFPISTLLRQTPCVISIRQTVGQVRSFKNKYMQFSWR